MDRTSTFGGHQFASDDIYLSKGEIMGFMQIQSFEISEIMTETSTEPSSLIYEDDDKEVLHKQEGESEKENVEKKFITSPADIEVHKKVELQNADIKPYTLPLKYTEWVQRELEILIKSWSDCEKCLTMG